MCEMRLMWWCALVLVSVSVCHARPQPGPQQLEQDAPPKAVFGSTFDEIVVETQLAVRPKSQGAGQRSGRAKPVFFRPNATAGAETRRIRPLEGTPSSSSTSSTERDGISSAARVVGVENPLAAGRARRVRRQWQWPGGFDSSSALASSQGFNNGLFGASASQAGSQSLGFGPSGFSGSAGQSASQTYHLPNGQTALINFSNAFNVSPDGPKGSNAASLTLSGPMGDKQTQQLWG